MSGSKIDTIGGMMVNKQVKMHYKVGDPYVNLALSILGKSRNTKLFQDLNKHFTIKKSCYPSVQVVTDFVGDWLEENHTVKGTCPKCREQIAVIPQCEMLTENTYCSITYCPACQSKILIE